MRFTAFWILLAAGPSLVLAQSLGDAARHEQERRRRVEAGGAKARVITDSDLGDSHPAPAAAPKDTTRPAPQGEGDGAHGEGDDRRDQEDMWRDKMQQARNRLEYARRRHEYLSTLVMVPGGYYVDEDTGRAVITSVEQLQRLTAGALADLKAAEQAIADLEERARRAGVPPGWLR